MTVRDELLYVGGLGKEWTSTTGELLNYNPQYVKTVNTDGAVKHVSWIHHYNDVKKATGIKHPGNTSPYTTLSSGI